MKVYIDLLPEKKKAVIREEKQFRSIVGMGFSFIFPIALLIGMLFAIKLILGIQGEGLGRAYADGQFQEGFQDLKRYEEKFQEINAKASLVSKVQDSHLEWAGILMKLSQTVPDEISIVGIATKDYRIFLIGRAKTREKLLEFQEQINTSECFSGVNMPLSNLVSRENIDFQLDFEVKKDCLKTR